MRANKKTMLLSGVLLTLLSACWEPEQVDVLRVVPGVVSLPGAQAVAVGEVAGPGGDAVGHLLAESLMELQRFTVLDWSSPHGLGGHRGGWADGKGDWQTADAAFLGSVQAPVLTPHYEAHTALASDGSEITTYSRTLTLSVAGYFRVLDPHNGLIISSSTVSGESTGPLEQVTLAGPPTLSDGSQLDGYFPPVPYATLQRLALQALVDEITALVAFTYEPTTITLYHDKRSPELVRAVEGAKKGQWREAVASYGQAVLEMEEHVPSKAYMAHYNYGVALAFSGEIARGMDEVRVAYALNKQAIIRDMLAQLQRYHDASLQLQGNNQVRR